MVNLIRWLMILTAFALLPLYGLWVVGCRRGDLRREGAEAAEIA